MAECEYCGVDYSDPDGIASDDYMEHGHIIFTCENPDLMERAYLNASPIEREKWWPE